MSCITNRVWSQLITACLVEKCFLKCYKCPVCKPRDIGGSYTAAYMPQFLTHKKLAWYQPKFRLHETASVIINMHGFNGLSGSRSVNISLSFPFYVFNLLYLQPYCESILLASILNQQPEYKPYHLLLFPNDVWYCASQNQNWLYWPGTTACPRNSLLVLTFTDNM